MSLGCNRNCINTVKSVCYKCDYNTFCTLCGEVKSTSECICEVIDDHNYLPQEDIDAWIEAYRSDIDYEDLEQT